MTRWVLSSLFFVALLVTVVQADPSLSRVNVVTFYSYPPGATVYQEADTPDGWQPIGKTVAAGASTESSGLSVAVGSGATVRIKIELRGHEVVYESLQVDRDRFPVQGALPLKPLNAMVAVQNFFVYRPALAAVAGLIVLALALLGGTSWRAVVTRRNLERRRADFFLEYGVEGEARSFGPYWELTAAGRGGFGTVRLVVPKHRLEHSEVRAMKTLPPEPVPADVIRRFKREIAISKELDHPNIVRIYDYGDLDGEFYLVMEYVKGGDLRKLLTRHAELREMLPLDQVLQCLREISEALGYAHDRGITHRDLKPENVLLDEAGHARLADFGLARRTIESKLITRTGVVGTMSHIAPEQLGGDVSPSVDQYSFGVLAYELLTLRLPFGQLEEVDDAKRLLEFLEGHLQRIPESLRTYRPDLPEALDQAVLRLLEKDPARRYDSIRAACQALEEAARSGVKR